MNYTTSYYIYITFCMETIKETNFLRAISKVMEISKLGPP